MNTLPIGSQIPILPPLLLNNEQLADYESLIEELRVRVRQAKVNQILSKGAPIIPPPPDYFSFSHLEKSSFESVLLNHFKFLPLVKLIETSLFNYWQLNSPVPKPEQ